jgi:hypothetical protein
MAKSRRMMVLSKHEDPTGFLNLFRMASADRFGDPSGVLHGRGRWPNLTKAGPGRRRTGPWNSAGSKLAKMLQGKVMRRGR